MEVEVKEKEELLQKALKDQDLNLAKLTNDISSQEALMKGLVLYK